MIMRLKGNRQYNDTNSTYAVRRQNLEQSLVLHALRMGLAGRRPRRDLLHHSDRGPRQACADSRTLLTEHGITCSMSRKGDCWDKAVAESFFATVKKELVHG